MGGARDYSGGLGLRTAKGQEGLPSETETLLAFDNLYSPQMVTEQQRKITTKS